MKNSGRTTLAYWLGIASFVLAACAPTISGASPTAVAQDLSPATAAPTLSPVPTDTAMPTATPPPTATFTPPPTATAVPPTVTPAPTATPDRAARESTVITFISHAAGRPEIFTIHTDGAGFTRLTDNDLAKLAPAWSPDGRLVAYLAGPAGGAIDRLQVLDPATAQDRPAAELVSVGAFAWAPDSARIALTGQVEPNGQRALYVVDLASGRRTALLPEDERDLYTVAWSPDGRWLAVEAARYPATETDIFMRREREILLVELETGETKLSAPLQPVMGRLFWTAASDWVLAQSDALLDPGQLVRVAVPLGRVLTRELEAPLGGQAAFFFEGMSPSEEDFLGLVLKNSPAGVVGRLYAAGLNGGPARAITGEDLSVQHAAWSPGGGQIALAVGILDHPLALYVIQPDGQGLQLLAENLAANSLTWQPAPAASAQ